MEEYYSQESVYKDRNDDYLTKNSPFYRTVESTFWSDDEEAKARAYYSAVEFIVNEETRNRSSGQSNRFLLKKDAATRLKGTITRESPIPDAWKRLDRGEMVSKYDKFRSKLGSEYFKEIELMEAIYKYKLTQWNIALRKYNEWDFK